MSGSQATAFPSLFTTRALTALLQGQAGPTGRPTVGTVDRAADPATGGRRPGAGLARRAAGAGDRARVGGALARARRTPARAQAHYGRAKIPLLAEAMAWVKAKGCAAVIEIKRERATAGREEKVLEIVDRAGVASQIAIISFHLATLRRIRQLDARIRIGIDFTRPLLALRRAESVGAALVLPHWAFASRRFVARAHGAGLQVVPWGVEAPASMRRMLAEGVDGLITGHPARLQRVAEHFGPWKCGFGAL